MAVTKHKRHHSKKSVTKHRKNRSIRKNKSRKLVRRGGGGDNKAALQAVEDAEDAEKAAARMEAPSNAPGREAWSRLKKTLGYAKNTPEPLRRRGAANALLQSFSSLGYYKLSPEEKRKQLIQATGNSSGSGVPLNDFMRALINSGKIKKKPSSNLNSGYVTPQSVGNKTLSRASTKTSRPNSGLGNSPPPITPRTPEPVSFNLPPLANSKLTRPKVIKVGQAPREQTVKRPSTISIGSTVSTINV